MTKDAQKKTKVYSKKMQKALKNAPILLGEDSEQNLQQIDWNDDRRLRYAKEQLFSRLSNDERHKARDWAIYFDDLTRGGER